MNKRIIAAAVAVGIAGGGVAAATAAHADVFYPPTAACTASPLPITVGAVSTITCTGFVEGPVTFSVTGPSVTDATLSSLVRAATESTDVLNTTANASGVATARFLGPAVGTYTVSVDAPEQEGASVRIEVVAAPTPTPTATTPAGGLPATGGTVPGAVVWAGIGIVGLGAIVTAAAASRRRRQGTD